MFTIIAIVVVVGLAYFFFKGLTKSQVDQVEAVIEKVETSLAPVVEKAEAVVEAVEAKVEATVKKARKPRATKKTTKKATTKKG
jgi:hypothetical protein